MTHFCAFAMVVSILLACTGIAVGAWYPIFVGLLLFFTFGVLHCHYDAKL